MKIIMLNMQNLPPEQQEAYRLHAQAQSAALAAGLIKRKGQVDDANESLRKLQIL